MSEQPSLLPPYLALDVVLAEGYKDLKDLFSFPKGRIPTTIALATSYRQSSNPIIGTGLG